jgi:hypothetical protein
MGNNLYVFHHSVTLEILIIFSLIAIFEADLVHGGDDACPPFSCGHLQDISYPFRRQGDPLGCGVEAYELVCTSSKATIHINTGTYYVTAINYTGSYFWVMDPSFNTNSSCPLPLWNHYPGDSFIDVDKLGSPAFYDLITRSSSIACFANCSRAVTNNRAYKPVACLSADDSHVYVWVESACLVGDLEPYCGYLAIIPFGEGYSFDWPWLQDDASYADITELISEGFTVHFPLDASRRSLSNTMNICLNNSIR